MVLILELKTVQSGAFRILTEALKEILNDVNFEFTPYYIDDDDNEESDDNSDSEGEEQEDESSDEENEKNTKLAKKKKVGGLKVMAVKKHRQF